MENRNEIEPEPTDNENIPELSNSEYRTIAEYYLARARAKQNISKTDTEFYYRTICSVPELSHYFIQPTNSFQINIAKQLCYTCSNFQNCYSLSYSSKYNYGMELNGIIGSIYYNFPEIDYLLSEMENKYSSEPELVPVTISSSSNYGSKQNNSYTRMKRKLVTCIICGSEYKLRKPGKHGYSKTCSRTCGSKLRYSKQNHSEP